MKSYTIVGYTFNTENYCVDCTREMFTPENLTIPADASTEGVLEAASLARGINRLDESSYDSSEFPKVIFASQIESDEEYCGNCHESLIG
jgi:hypothetical protein